MASSNWSTAICFFTLFIVVFVAISESFPVNEAQDHSGDTVAIYPEMLGIRLGVLNDTANSLKNNMSKYESLCKITKAAKLVYQQTANSSSEISHLIAKQQISDVCNLMITHVDSDLDCSTTVSSVQTVETLCEEISKYAKINERVNTVIQIVLQQIETIPEKSTYVGEFTEQLPESVQAIICAPYGC